MSFVHAGVLSLDTDVFTRQRCRGDLFVQYGKGLSYFRMTAPELIQDYIDKLEPDSVLWVEIDPSVALPPHRDRGTVTSLNLYISPNGATTSFWKPKAGEEPGYWPQEERPTLKDHWRPEQLDFVESFVAEPGDAYWLDVTNIHTVHGTKGPLPRTFIQLCWNTKPYDQLACVF